MTSASLHVDPRMKARRIAVMRAKGRRRLRILLSAVSVLLAGAAVWGVSQSPLLDVDHITITGSGPTQIAEIYDSTRLETGQAMLFLDLDQIADTVSDLPWVKSAAARRDWPATVHIDVVPRVPAAVVPTENGLSALIDSSAYVISWAQNRLHDDAAHQGTTYEDLTAGATTGSLHSKSLQSASADLPGDTTTGAPRGATASLAGDTIAQVPVGDLVHLSVPFDGDLGAIHVAADGPLAVAEAIPEDLDAWVQTVTVDPEGQGLGLLLHGGAEVALGAPILLDHKMEALRALLAGIDLTCITYINVTMPDIATVRRHPQCQEQ